MAAEVAWPKGGPSGGEAGFQEYTARCVHYLRGRTLFTLPALVDEGELASRIATIAFSRYKPAVEDVVVNATGPDVTPMAPTSLSTTPAVLARAQGVYGTGGTEPRRLRVIAQ